MNATRRNQTSVIHTCLRAVILLYCFLVAAGSDVTTFDQDDDVVTDESVRTLFDLEDLFDDGLSSPTSSISNSDENKDIQEKESSIFSQSDNAFLTERDEKRTKSHSIGAYSSDFSSLPSSAHNSSSKRFKSSSDVDLDGNRRIWNSLEKEDSDFMAEELFVPVPYDSKDSAVLSRSKRDLIAGSGQELLKTELTAQGTPTAAELDDTNVVNIQLRLDVAEAVLLYLTAAYPGETFQTEVTQVRQGSYIFAIDIVYETENLAIEDLARAYDDLTILKVGDTSYTILEQDLAPSTNTNDLRPAICYLCEVPQTCESTTRDDGSSDWFCSTESDYYYSFGFGQGDSTLGRGDELATAQITVQSQFPYNQELVTDVYISVNGIISFDVPYASFDVTRLPVGDLKLLAPYWADLDLTVSDSSANVFYQLYTKSPTNSPSQLAVLTRANSEVVSRMQTVTSYDATNVIIVTWEAVPPWPGSLSSSERVHFQVAIITDGSSTYVSYVYAQGGMNFNPVLNRRVEIGWGSVNFSPSGTSHIYYQFDAEIGNTNLPGYWFFQIGERPNSRALCLAWFTTLNTPAYRAVIDALNFIVPPCPCSERVAFFHAFWLPSFEQARCYDMFPLLGQYGRRCCYRLDGSLGFENRIPLAGSLQLFTPYYPVAGNLQNHEAADVIPKQWCCFESGLCPLYYLLRPARPCIGRPFKRSLLWGDPHMKTLDGKEYSFNGLGEYIIMKMEGQYTTQTQVNGTTEDTNRTIDFELQGRTCRSRTSSGNLTEATQWCALAGRNTDNTTFRIGLGSTEPIYMEIYANNEDYSARFRENPDFSTFAGNLALRRENNSLTIFTPDNLGVTVTLFGEVIEMSFQVDENLKGLCSGLFGNFNDNSTDDLIYRNNTVLPDSASDEEIFHMGQSWAITQEESLFVYELNRTTAFYSDPDFQPLFLDQVNSSVRTDAENVCGGGDNIACVFDYIATQNTELAEQSKIVIVTFDEQEADISNIAPNITQLVEIETIVNETTNFTINAFDSDGSSIQFILLEQPSEGLLVYSNQSGVLQASFTPANTNPVTISVVAQDENGLQSEISQVTIKNCGGCNGNGICNYNTTISEEGNYYTVSPCICSLPYSGVNCQDDKPGCEGNPCPTGTTCSDIPAEEELDLGRAYNCSDCPSGYQLANDSTKCIDIDECDTNTDECDNNAICTNTIGSHFCTCNSGYRKSVSGQNCVDIDECTENSFKCDQICINTDGSYDCECNEGFQISGLLNRTCTRLDQDPCQDLQNDRNCSYGCRNSSGEAVCFCEAGFRVASDGFSCENVDECEDSLLCAQQCTDNDGSYVCSCYAGFRLNVDEHDCDPCADNEYGTNCSKSCECRGRATSCDPVQGCICLEQWTGENCLIDVNECLTPNICPEDKSCVNTNGSYYCSCPVGFEDANNDGNCTDINECASISVHQCPQDCVNNPGSYQCVCNSGYNYNSTRNECDDINECIIGTSGCNQRCENTLGSFNCFCLPGYVLAEDRKDCILEQDLCTNKPESCSQGCTVVEEVPTCICTIGFNLGTDGVTCFDINECDNGNNLCSDFCDNTNGSYSCSCPSGKQLQNDLRTCTDCDAYHWGPNCANECACDPIGAERCDPEVGCICNGGRSGDQCQNDNNECLVPVSPCPENADCVDIVGSYSCNCRTGYQLNDTNECEDIDECENSPCDHKCNNTIGSYVCSCFPGFNTFGDRCIDINECDQPSDVHGCQHVCRNTQGSYSCQCFEGYKLNTTNRRNCAEIVDRTTCFDNNTCDTECRLENGEEICFCNPGFTLSLTNSSLCEDINECIETRPCVGGNCTNNEGGFSCSCDPGFRLSDDRITCIACEEGKYGSGCSGTCSCDTTNTQECRPDDGTCVCISGYNGTDCENNINECESGEASCQANSECRDIPGSYQCICNVGFAASASDCIPCSSTTYGQNCDTQCSCVVAHTDDCNDVNGTCTCKPQWQGVNCSEDVNECDNSSLCSGQNEYCENEAGSYQCRCNSSYTRISGICYDIDECLVGTHNCESPRVCNNTDGGFKCDCDSGYEENNGVCEDIDECLEGTHTCESPQVCNNTDGGFNCDCGSGYEENNGVCEDIDECQQDVCIQNCNNTEGSYNCECRNGYVEDNGGCTALANLFNLTITFGANITSVDASNIENALRNIAGIRDLGAVIESLTVTNIRTSQSGVELELVIDEQETNDIDGTAAVVADILNNAGPINISSEAQSTSITSLEINDNTVSADASVCSIFLTLESCGDGFECKVTNNVPSCQETSDDNHELIIGLGVGIPLFIFLVIIIAVAVCLCLRKSRRSERESTPSVDRDAPFRSVFAGQVATKSSLGSPHRFSMYSPDAYSEAGTSDSSGDGQLLKSRQKVRSDFQDSPWYDNRGATPRDPTESQGAPTEAGAGPTSNFSWEYMFRLLEPHRGFEIQRPNLSPAPNPTYTPRGKQSESPA